MHDFECVRVKSLSVLKKEAEIKMAKLLPLNSHTEG